MRRLLLLGSLIAVGVACFVLYAALGSPTRPSVVIITLDTFRADAISREQTPFLREFLGTATRFRGARTVVPLTLPTHTSIFTGLYPGRHHVHDNVAAPIPPREERDFSLLAEDFRTAGYVTAAVVAHGVLGADSGIASGFEYYRCTGGKEGIAPGPGGYAPAEAQVDAALAWLADRDPERPFLLWIHLFDPHTPYLAYEGDGRRAASRADDRNRHLYYGEIRRVDAALERLLGGIGPDPVVVVVSDHGEGLDEHHETTHGPLCYGTTADAIMAVRAPGFEPGAVDHAPRSVCDVAPTLREICGLDARAADGRSLSGPAAEVVFTESLYVWRIHGWGQCFSASDGRFTLVESGPAVEFFDRESDPSERRPLAASARPAFEKLERALRDWREGGTDSGREWRVRDYVVPYAGARRPFTAYLAREENARLADPRDFIEAWHRLGTIPPAIAASAARRDVEALRGVLETCRDLATRTAESPLPHQYAAYALFELGRVTDDVDAFRAAVRAQCAAIERGHVLGDSFLAAVEYAVLGQDPDGLAEVFRLAEQKRLQPDAETVAAMRAAARTLGLEEDAVLARLMARAAAGS